jgi:hypothetical protein
MLDFEDMITGKGLGNLSKVKVKIDPKTKKPIKTSAARVRANKQVTSTLKGLLTKPKVKVSITKKPVAPVTKISVKPASVFNKKAIVKTQVVKKVSPTSSIRVDKIVATKQPYSVTDTAASERAKQKQLQNNSKSLAKLSTIQIKSAKSTSVSPAKKIADIKKTVKEIKRAAPDISSTASKKKVAKAAVLASKVSNKPSQVVAQKAALPDVVKSKAEEKISLPAITEVLNDSSTPPKESSLILTKLDNIQQNIIKQQDDAFRGNVLTKLKSIDNKVRSSTLSYQGALGHIKQDSLL